MIFLLSLRLNYIHFFNFENFVQLCITSNNNTHAIRALQRSKKLFEQAKKVIPSGVNSPVRHFKPYPFFVRRSDGSSIWDADGKHLLDLCNGYGALLLGHRRKEIISAVSRQLNTGTLYCTPTEQEVELARLIIGNFPSIDMVRLVNTGAEATMTAIRLARGHTGKKKIVKFEGCYHGTHDSVLVNAGSGYCGIPASDGGPAGVSEQTLVARYNDFGDIETILAKDNDVAGVIIEPVMANSGLILPKKNFLKHVRKITRQYGVPLIFDEVVTGFRISAGGAQQHFEIKPDITTLAKALGNGFAIAAVGGKKQIMERLAPYGSVYQASTFAGNPISVSAALASVRTINKIKSKIYPKLERYCEQFSRGVGDIATDYNIPHQINAVSSMMQIFFSQNPVIDQASSMNSDTEKFKKMFSVLLKNRVFVAPSQFEVVFFSNAHSKADLSMALDAYGDALKAVRD